MEQQPDTCVHAGPGRPRLFDEATGLEAALRVFWEKGYRMTTLEDLTTAMGLSRSSLYGCYGSKHDIYLAAFRSYNETSLKALTALAKEAPTPREAVRRVFSVMADTGGDRRGCFFANCVTEMAPHDPEVKDLSRRQHDRIEDLLADAYRRSGASGDADARARAVMSVAIGAVQMRKAGVETDRLEALAAQIELLLPVSKS